VTFLIVYLSSNRTVSYCSGGKSTFNWLIMIDAHTANSCAMPRPSIVLENNKVA
jgi:hypothetical protein